jgi:hypothetical protein
MYIYREGEREGGKERGREGTHQSPVMSIGGIYFRGV